MSCILPLELRRGDGTGEQVVPPKAWDALQSWYEGGPWLERRVINYHGSLQLELFPLSLKVRRRSGSFNDVERMTSALSEEERRIERREEMVRDGGHKRTTARGIVSCA